MKTGRVLLIALLTVSVVINYIDRGTLSVVAPAVSEDIALSPEQFGILFSSFFWAYALLQLFGIAGWLADRFNVLIVLAVGLFFWTSATALTGLAGSFAGLLMLRLLLGAGESVAYPCYSRIIVEYIPEQDRGIANAMIDAGTKLGPAIGTFAAGMLVGVVGWRVLFIVVGCVGLLWLWPWLRWKPVKIGTRTQEAAQTISSGQVLRIRSAWGTFVGHFCANYFWYFLLTWLPLYLVRERGFTTEGMATVGSLAYLVIALATITAARIADVWISRGGTVTRARKAMTVGGLGIASCVVFVPALESGNASLVLLFIACAAYGVFASSHWAITQTLAGPLAAGRWTSIQNGVANLAGIAAPWVTGLVVAKTNRFWLAFVAAALVSVLGAFAYAFVVGPVRQTNFVPQPALTRS